MKYHKHYPTLNQSCEAAQSRPRKRPGGFTIVELLIVIVVIAILAAITIVAYNGIQNRANDSAVASDLTSIAKKVELWKVDNGTYPPNLNTALTSDPLYNVKVDKSAYSTATHNLVYCTLSPYTSYAVIAVSKSGNPFYVLNSSKPTQYTGTQSGSGWIVAANTSCPDALPGSSAAGAVGYNSGTSTWATWTGP